MKTYRLTSLLALLIFASSLSASVTITKVCGWFESGYVQWLPMSAAEGYEVYCKEEGSAEWIQLDKELVRDYATYLRADAVGLKAGHYRFRIVPHGDGLGETAAMESDIITVRPYDRSGFAHQGRTEGVGAYNNDGTLKKNTKVLYINATNAKTVKASILYDKGETEFVGLQAILKALEKGKEKVPICIRIIGCIKNTDMDYFESSAEGLQVKGKNNTIPMNITIEGIGDDATIWGFGILARNLYSAEFRNFAVMLCMDDCISIDTDNRNVWIHNIDFFYGKTGKDADQAKGDGTVDTKGCSKFTTISYNHYFDCGKVNLGGMKSETTDCYHTYHHNWFDHCDSRMPRIRTMSFHIYNNYYDGISNYGVGMTYGGSAFVESNYFRNCKYPMLISRQGTDATGSGTFSKENGGVIKAFNNLVKNAAALQYINATSTQKEISEGKWDAYLVERAEEKVPANVTCLVGGTPYLNFDTDGTLTYIPSTDDVESVPDIVMADAGRMNGGDFKWQFDNAKEDENKNLNSSLKNELINYQSSLKAYFDGMLNPHYGNQKRSGGDSEKHPDYVPTWSGGGAGISHVATADRKEMSFNTRGQKSHSTDRIVVMKGRKYLQH